MIIETENLCFSYGNNRVLNNINIQIDSNSAVALLGPNGAGKTTLFECLLGLLKPQSGQVSVNGKNIQSYSRKELSKLIAYIPQNFDPVFNHTVLDTVIMGITNQIGFFENPSEKHIEMAMGLLKTLGIDSLANRGCMEISGGERQLMLMARAMIQNARLLIMDEPTANLDFGNTIKVLNQIETLAAKGYSVLLSTHNPNHALKVCSRFYALKNGEIAANYLDGNTLCDLYGTDLKFCESCGQIIL